MVGGFRPVAITHLEVASVPGIVRGGFDPLETFNRPGQRFAFVFGARTEGLVIFCKCVDAKRLSIDLFWVIEHGSGTVQAPKCTPYCLSQNRLATNSNARWAI